MVVTSRDRLTDGEGEDIVVVASRDRLTDGEGEDIAVVTSRDRWTDGEGEDIVVVTSRYTQTLERAWKVKVSVEPVVTGALEAVTPKLEKWLEHQTTGSRKATDIIS